MSLPKALGYGLATFVAKTILGMFVGCFCAFFASLPLLLLGAEKGSTPVVIVAAIAFALVIFICWASALDDALDAIKTRPRGLGIRMKRQSDGSYTEERH